MPDKRHCEVVRRYAGAASSRTEGNAVKVDLCLGYHELDAVKILFGEYVTLLGLDLGFQDYEREVRTLPGPYALPRGRLYLLREGTEPVGCAALRPLNGAACEMKRLYVRPSYRGRGYGDRLVNTLIDDARHLGYARMYLDTFPWMEAAVAMYRKRGFREVEAYYPNPYPSAVYFCLDLATPEADGLAADGRKREKGHA